MATQAETVARSITDPSRQADALTAVARALVQAGQEDPVLLTTEDHSEEPEDGIVFELI